jgi:P5-type ATPase cation transporter
MANFILPKNCQEEGVISSIQMYDQPGWKTAIYYVLCVLIAVGIWWLLVRWELGLRKATLMTPSNLSKAKHLIITSMEQEVEHIQIERREDEKVGLYVYRSSSGIDCINMS